MNQKNKYEYLADFINNLRANGRYTFTREEVISQFDLGDEAYHKVIKRLQDKERISRIRQNFYVITPPEYAARKSLPFEYYIDDLMQYLDREYYVGMLTAAMYHGASHQQPQRQFVVVEPPYLRPIENPTQSVIFCKKKRWNKRFIAQQKTDAGYINISNPSLTALDLVFYMDRIGGLNRAAEVLSELCAEIEPDNFRKAAEHFDQTTTLQRTGYLLGEILGELEVSDVLFDVLQSRKYYPTLLRTDAESDNMKAPNRWKVVPNIEVQIEP